jgi:hypothetical protein
MRPGGARRGRNPVEEEGFAQAGEVIRQKSQSKPGALGFGQEGAQEVDSRCGPTGEKSPVASYFGDFSAGAEPQSDQSADHRLYPLEQGVQSAPVEIPTKRNHRPKGSYLDDFLEGTSAWTPGLLPLVDRRRYSFGRIVRSRRHRVHASPNAPSARMPPVSSPTGQRGSMRGGRVRPSGRGEHLIGPWESALRGPGRRHVPITRCRSGLTNGDGTRAAPPGRCIGRTPVDCDAGHVTGRRSKPLQFDSCPVISA